MTTWDLCSQTTDWLVLILTQALRTVSYTHLDVYKRQVISGAVLLAAVAILAAHDSMSDTPKSKEEWKDCLLYTSRCV